MKSKGGTASAYHHCQSDLLLVYSLVEFLAHSYLYKHSTTVILTQISILNREIYHFVDWEPQNTLGNWITVSSRNANPASLLGLRTQGRFQPCDVVETGGYRLG